MSNILAVAFGGAIGAVGRYLLMGAIGVTGFPLATIIVNIAGSFILGSLLEISALSWSVSETMRAFLVVGCLGAFTTFSTFSMDVIYLMQKGDILKAALYIGLSVTLAVLSFAAGMYLFRHILN